MPEETPILRRQWLVAVVMVAACGSESGAQSATYAHAASQEMMAAMNALERDNLRGAAVYLSSSYSAVRAETMERLRGRGVPSKLYLEYSIANYSGDVTKRIVAKDRILGWIEARTDLAPSSKPVDVLPQTAIHVLLVEGGYRVRHFVNSEVEVFNYVDMALELGVLIQGDN